jgi:hypothetical protein
VRKWLITSRIARQAGKFRRKHWLHLGGGAPGGHGKGNAQAGLDFWSLSTRAVYARKIKGQAEKDFEGDLRAILIQEKHTTENIDSRNCLLAVKNCTLIVGHRLFQQHRPKGDMRANNARACERRVRNDLSSSCRRQSTQSIQKRTSQLRAPRAFAASSIQKPKCSSTLDEVLPLCVSTMTTFFARQFR